MVGGCSAPHACAKGHMTWTFIALPGLHLVLFVTISSNYRKKYTECNRKKHNRKERNVKNKLKAVKDRTVNFYHDHEVGCIYAGYVVYVVACFAGGYAIQKRINAQQQAAFDYAVSQETLRLRSEERSVGEVCSSRWQS